MEKEEEEVADDKVEEEQTQPVEGDRKGAELILRRRSSLLRAGQRQNDDKEHERKDHLQELLHRKQAEVRYVDERLRQSRRAVGAATTDVEEQQADAVVEDPRAVFLTEASMNELETESEILAKAFEILEETRRHFGQIDFPMEIRMQNFNFTVLQEQEDELSDNANHHTKKISTVYNASFLYRIVKLVKRKWHGLPRPQPVETVILDDINLLLRPGQMHLVLGPPNAGKSTLLRAIAGRLHIGNNSKNESIAGTVSYNGKTMMGEKGLYIENLVSFIEQLDRHAARLSVDETFEFAFQCKTGGGKIDDRSRLQTQAAKEFVQKTIAERLRVNIILEALGLDHVRDTYVGDTVSVRGVSGGQRRRVTVGEMLMQRSPILCGDEISTGLDAASTYQIVKILMFLGRAQKLTRVVSLLQPSPETVSLFDEIILLAEGKLLYSGPIADVEEYFASLGYIAPDQMDVADFLQNLTITADAVKCFDSTKTERSTPYTPAELAELFKKSALGQRIQDDLQKSKTEALENDKDNADFYGVESYKLRHKYANSFPRNTWLNLKRMLMLWSRDKHLLITNAIKILVMGASVGGVFFQTEDYVSIMGVLFQGVLFIMLGAMNTAPGLIDDREIFYKHHDANFFSAYPYVFARSISQMPQMFVDLLIYGSFLYWMIGLTATAKNFLIFFAVLFVFDVLLSQFYSIFGAFAKTKSDVLVWCSCTMLFLMTFGGYIVAPSAIPNYYIWIYWWNPMAWAYRALAVNEFRSSDYTKEESDAILTVLGFLDSNGEPFGQEWVGYSFAYMLPYTLLSIILASVGLTYFHHSGDSAPPNAPDDDQQQEQQQQQTEESDEAVAEKDEISIPFKPVTLTFENICYDVKASKTKETLRLLNKVNGVFRSGRMCALMGASGAGKTTLLDVISLRKNKGTITGEVRLNGFLQESAAFRRCSGYVEQFDVQSPQLTVRETVLFSARLRLDPEVVKTDDDKQKFVDQVLRTLELESLSNCPVGNDEEGGLSFEQNKRLSIAVSLAASPSIIFLDEPTSGLDARSALLVVKALRTIANEGRTICATIHQPSFTVFHMFDDLLLLEKGGRVVFFGKLGSECQNLIDYFQARKAPPIELGENPANWMLKVISKDSDDTCDLAKNYLESDGFKELQKELQLLKEEADPENEISFSTEYAVSQKKRSYYCSKRLSTIYWRSPAYNYARIMVSLVIAFLMGSVFLADRRPEVLTESHMNGLLSVIFLSFIIIGILAINSVMPLMLSIRDMYYRHKAAGMIDSQSLAWSLGVAEKWFIVLSSALFVVIFLPVAGLMGGVRGGIAFWGFFTFSSALYSYFGQAFVCLVGPMSSAQILGTIYIGLNNFFSGLIVRPQYLYGFFEIPFWMTPGHYVYEGLVVSQFQNDDRPVLAIAGSDFYLYLKCDSDDCIAEVSCNPDECIGTAWQFVESFFGGRFSADHTTRNALILAGFLVLARALAFLGLRYFNYTAY